MDDIVPFDLHRMFIGDQSLLVLAELVVRVAIIWLWTIVLLRWVGGRSISQMSVVEFLLVIALGSAVGDAMYMPEVPLIHAMVVILCVILCDKALDYTMRRWADIKSFVDGMPVEVVQNGQIVHDGILARNIGNLELMELLRIHKVRNLGEIESAFLEPSGQLSLLRFAEPRPGLRIFPPPESHKPGEPGQGDTACCTRCGRLGQPSGPCCDICGNREWTAAVTEKRLLDQR